MEKRKMQEDEWFMRLSLFIFISVLFQIHHLSILEHGSIVMYFDYDEKGKVLKGNW